MFVFAIMISANEEGFQVVKLNSSLWRLCVYHHDLINYKGRKKFEDTKGVVRNSKSQKDRQHNGQKEKKKKKKKKKKTKG